MRLAGRSEPVVLRRSNMTSLTHAVLALAAVAACIPLAAQTQHSGEYRISGPYTHDNLSIFLFHGPNRSATKLLTLEEAIDQRKVVVYETRNVNELAVEN